MRAVELAIALLVGLILGFAATVFVVAALAVHLASRSYDFAPGREEQLFARPAAVAEQVRDGARSSGGDGSVPAGGDLAEVEKPPKTRQPSRCAFCEGVRRALGLKTRDLVRK